MDTSIGYSSKRLTKNIKFTQTGQLNGRKNLIKDKDDYMVLITDNLLTDYPSRILTKVYMKALTLLNSFTDSIFLLN